MGLRPPIIAMPKKNTGTSASSELIKLVKVSFGTPPFRKLGTIDLNIAPRLTLIAGRNGVGKSTVLALAAGGSGLTRGIKYKTYFGSLPNPSAEDILKLSYARDFVAEESLKPHVLLTYAIGNDEFQKKGNVSGSVDRLRVVPRNEPKGKFVFGAVEIPADGKVPIPTIYLGMTRVLPIGEAEPESIERNKIQMDPEDYRVYWEFTDRIISPGHSGVDGNVTSQVVKGTKKRSVYPDYNGYDSTNVSLGQDSLSAIATALASFSKLKRTLGADYRGGLLIIDELDAGFHPHAQIELLAELKSKARELGIQVIATTHSLTMLEQSHRDIYDKRRSGPKLDEIIYLKGGRPIQLLDASDFGAIYADMHLMLRLPPSAPTVKIYLEDDEAALFLNAILTRTRKAQLKAKTNCQLKIIPVKVGCQNLLGLIKADEYFESVVIVLDGDTQNFNSGHYPNVVRLPIDPRNKKKQSPEVIIKAMCEKMCAEDDAYPETRKKLAALNADTEYLERKILALQRGEAKPLKSVESDRDVAKNWFNKRLTAIKEMKLIEGWVADNATGVETFMLELERAIGAALARREAVAAGLANLGRRV
jgi:predicted ATPase